MRCILILFIAVPLAAQELPRLVELLEERDSARLLELWDTHADTIVATCADWIPLPGSVRVEAVAPGGSLTLGDNGGWVWIARDPDEAGRSGHELFDGRLYALELAERQAGLLLPRSSHTWTAVVLSPGALGLVAEVDGQHSVGQLVERADGESRAEVVRLLLLLAAKRGLVWTEATGRPSAFGNAAQLREIAGEAPDGGWAVSLEWAFECFWGE